ncbi:TIGR03088 family PEP-CTERM/XrtA system glycosyltransferase [Variovorax sp. YR752]|uniref:TIGR03088 family PEP-CTERM/XrtA system glycosyltransferase n=1 Tax=Variovorax sp. YR752 TaxID=1884383 RepID=UPI0031382575
MASSIDPRPLVAHVVYRFDVGGLENGVVNLINRMPAERFRHAVIAMTEIGEIRRRVQRDDVQFHALRKPPGQGLRVAPRLVGLLRQLRPAVVHTRNLGALEMSLPAAWAGVPVRVHGEHGWDSNDPDGRSIKCQWIRRCYRPFVHRYVALSRHLERYLVERVGVPPRRISQLYNGVDTLRFHGRGETRLPLADSPFAGQGLWVAGTVGRLHAIKDQVLLARAFVRARTLAGSEGARLRLAIAGDGPLRGEVQSVLDDGGVSTQAWLAGERDDVPEFMRSLDQFVLPSRAEGISNTILEAMASGLPVIATDVGGNAELLEEGRTGRLVPAGEVDAMAQALLADFHDPDAARARGRRACTVAQSRFSLDGMVAAYSDLYERLLTQAAQRGALQRA